jgi:MoxR-like ATPase
MDEEQSNEIKSKVNRIKEEVAKRLIGQEEAVDLMVAALLVEGHILIEGMPGLAKTLAARLLARTLDVDFKRIQFTPDLMPSDILGTSIFNFANSEFEFRKGPVFSNFILIDEINRSPAKTQSALFELMQERQVTIDGETYPMDKPFLVIATQNPIEMEGTYRLPEAQMDRFLFKVDFDYPALEEEVSILQTYNKLDTHPSLEEVERVIKGEELLSFRKLVQAVHIEDKLLRYIATILQRTREHPDLEIGASPRAGVGWMHAAKAWALMHARQYVIPDDILALAAPILSHRITLTPEKEMEGAEPAKVAQKIAKMVEVPA